MHVETYVEIDIPLTASTEETFRFTYAQEEYGHEAIPAMTSLSITPAVVDPGVSIGVRANVRVQLRDFQYPLAGTDVNKGTFFGKLRARRKSLQGLPLRVIRGEAGQSLSEMRTEHYVIESLSRSGDNVTITAKDLLKLADGDRAQAPAVSTGRLLNAIVFDDIFATLTPTGIGDAEYPTSGKVAIGGSEICSFTRSGDTLTLTARGESGTEPQDHDADETVQLVLEFTSASPADIVFTLLTEYTPGIDPDWCPVDEWKQDVDEYIGRLYTAEIAEPTEVKTLLNELIEQVGLVIWWDPVDRKVRLKSLRPVTSARDIDQDEMMADSFKFSEQPSKRVSEVWTYFALRNPLEDLEDTKNYRSVVVTVDPDASGEYEQPAIRKVFSRWIGINNRPAASRLNQLLLSRYRDPPRKFSFSLFRTSEAPEIGQGVNLLDHSLQDADGNPEAAPAQITSLEMQEDRYVCDAEEMLFTEIDGSESGAGASRLIIIDTSVNNVNLRTIHDSLYTDPDADTEVTCIIESGVVIGSTSISVPAFDVGTWPSGATVTITNNGRIQGKGGNGGKGPPTVSTAQAGGTAFYTRYAVDLTNNGEIYGGGGGGGRGQTINVGEEPNVILIGASGGGGAGTLPGLGGPGAFDGTSESGGAGSTVSGSSVGGRGGDPGEAGQQGGASGGPGGAAGPAVDGESFVTYSEVGTILGPRVN